MLPHLARAQRRRSQRENADETNMDQDCDENHTYFPFPEGPEHSSPQAKVRFLPSEPRRKATDPQTEAWSNLGQWISCSESIALLIDSC